MASATDADSRNQHPMRYETLDDDREAFDQAMQGVAPLGRRSKAPAAPHQPATPSLASHAPQHMVDAALDTQRVQPISGNAILDWKRPGLLNKEYQKLRTGKLKPPPKEFDLHGTNMKEAAQAIAQAIDETQRDGRRSLCLIHGKGSRSNADGSPIKGVADYVLRRHPDVLGFHSVPRNTGAVNVLLRKPRA